MNYIDFVEFHSCMHHAKFQNHMPSGSREKRLALVRLALIGPGVSEKNMFEKRVAGDNGHFKSYRYLPNKLGLNYLWLHQTEKDNSSAYYWQLLTKLYSEINNSSRLSMYSRYKHEF